MAGEQKEHNILTQEHEDAFVAAGLPFPPTLEDMLQGMGPKVNQLHYLQLSPRMRQALYYLIKTGKIDKDPPVDKIQVVDLNPAFERLHVMLNRSPCIVPSGWYWIQKCDEGRLMEPEEAFRLMSWDLDELGVPWDRAAFSYREGFRLAGAAFEAHSVMAATTILLACMP